MGERWGGTGVVASEVMEGGEETGEVESERGAATGVGVVWVGEGGELGTIVMETVHREIAGFERGDAAELVEDEVGYCGFAGTGNAG